MQTNIQHQRFSFPELFAILPSYPNLSPGMWYPMQNFVQPIPSYPYPGTSCAPCTGLQVSSYGYAHTIETGPWNQLSNSAFLQGLYPISNIMGPNLLQGCYPIFNNFSQQPSSNILGSTFFQGSYPASNNMGPILLQRSYAMSNNINPILVEQPCPSFNNMGPCIPVQPTLGSTDVYYPRPNVIGPIEEPVVVQLGYVSVDSFNHTMDPHEASMNMNSSNDEATIEASDLEPAEGNLETAVVPELSELEYFENQLSVSIPSKDKEIEQTDYQGTAMEHELRQEDQADQDGHSEAKPPRTNTFCNLCKSNKESKNVYTSHVLRNASGIVQCPILRTFVCPTCNATGDNAHTRRHCPMMKQEFQHPFLYSKQTNSTGDQVVIRYL